MNDQTFLFWEGQKDISELSPIDLRIAGNDFSKQE